MRVYVCVHKSRIILIGYDTFIISTQTVRKRFFHVFVLEEDEELYIW